MRRLPRHTITTVRSEIRGPLVALLAFWFLTALAIATFADSVWLLALAAVGVAIALGLLLWAVWPRRGDLIRLVLDRNRELIYWAHQGREPEELPFAAVRAIIVEPLPGGRLVRLWATDSTGHASTLGTGDRRELEPLGRELAETLGAPLWYREGDLSRTGSAIERAFVSHPGPREE